MLATATPNYDRVRESLLGSPAGGVRDPRADESPDGRETTALRRLVLEVLGSSLSDSQKLDKIRGLMNDSDPRTEAPPSDEPKTPVAAAIKREQWNRNFGSTVQHLNEQLPGGTPDISESIDDRLARLESSMLHEKYPPTHGDFRQRLRRR